MSVFTLHIDTIREKISISIIADLNKQLKDRYLDLNEQFTNNDNYSREAPWEEIALVYHLSEGDMIWEIYC